MDKTTFTKWALVILIFLLTLDVSARLFLASSDVGAREKVQYKVVSTQTIKTGVDYEELLNSMANQGWRFDHFIELADLAVFRNQSPGDFSLEKGLSRLHPAEFGGVKVKRNSRLDIGEF